MKYLYKSIRAKNNDIIRGVLNTPDNFCENKKYTAIIFFHGLMDDRNGINYMSIQHAKYLTAAGYLVYRFDFRGCGESEGSFFDLTFTRQIEDGQSIYEFVENEEFVDRDKIFIRAHSMGGTVAIKLAQLKNPKGLILYAPGSNYSLENSNLIKSLDKLSKSQGLGEKDLGGIKLSAKIVDDSRKYNFLTMAEDYKGKVIMIRGEKDPVIEKESMTLLEKKFSDCKYIEIENIGHNFTSYEKRLEMFELTNDFIRENI